MACFESFDHNQEAPSGLDRPVRSTAEDIIVSDSVASLNPFLKDLKAIVAVYFTAVLKNFFILGPLIIFFPLS